MPTDLTAVRDHPAAILAAIPQGASPQPTGLLAALALLEHEERHGVTFAALDNDALASVREAYDALDNTEPTFEQVRDLARSVADLLGLE